MEYPRHYRVTFATRLGQATLSFNVIADNPKEAQDAARREFSKIVRQEFRVSTTKQVDTPPSLEL